MGRILKFVVIFSPDLRTILRVLARFLQLPRLLFLPPMQLYHDFLDLSVPTICINLFDHNFKNARGEWWCSPRVACSLGYSEDTSFVHKIVHVCKVHNINVVLFGKTLHLGISPVSFQVIVDEDYLVWTEPYPSNTV